MIHQDLSNLDLDPVLLLSGSIQGLVTLQPRNMGQSNMGQNGAGPGLVRKLKGRWIQETQGRRCRGNSLSVMRMSGTWKVGANSCCQDNDRLLRFFPTQELLCCQLLSCAGPGLYFSTPALLDLAGSRTNTKGVLECFKVYVDFPDAVA